MVLVLWRVYGEYTRHRRRFSFVRCHLAQYTWASQYRLSVLKQDVKHSLSQSLQSFGSSSIPSLNIIYKFSEISPAVSCSKRTDHADTVHKTWYHPYQSTWVFSAITLSLPLRSVPILMVDAMAFYNFPTRMLIWMETKWVKRKRKSTTMIKKAFVSNLDYFLWGCTGSQHVTNEDLYQNLP